MQKKELIKKYLRKVLLLVSISSMMLLSGCSNTCKHTDCDNEVYKDGYCKIHYATSQAGKAINEMIPDIE